MSYHLQPTVGVFHAEEDSTGMAAHLHVDSDGDCMHQCHDSPARTELLEIQGHEAGALARIHSK